jgi:hypothetical protein
MDVNGYRMDPIKPGAPEPAQPVRERPDPPLQESADRPRGDREDRVEISPDGRRAAEAAADTAETDIPEGTLSADRLLELRRRIQARVHDDPQVVDEMIRRMVGRGDL